MIFNLKIYKEKMNTSVTAVCIVFSLQRVRGVYSKCNFPFPHVFGLRRLRNAIRLVRFGYNSSTGRVVLRVAPISPFPLCTMFEGTHGERVAGDNTDAIDFVAIASSLRATNG